MAVLVAVFSPSLRISRDLVMEGALEPVRRRGVFWVLNMTASFGGGNRIFRAMWLGEIDLKNGLVRELVLLNTG